MTQSIAKTPEKLNRVLVLTTSVVVAASLLALLGWRLGSRPLTSFGPRFATMKPNTALCLISAAWATWLSRTPELRKRHSVWVAALTVFVTLAALLTLAEYMFQWNAGIDELLFRDPEHLGSAAPPGRPAPGTAFTVLLVIFGVFSIDKLPRLSHTAALSALIIALVGLLGYVYDLPTLYGTGRFTSLALNTVIGFLALAIGLLASRPERGLTGLLSTARPHRSQIQALVVGAVVLPIFLGSAALWGQRRGLYGAEFTLVLFAGLQIVLIVALVWVTGAEQLVIEGHRSVSEKALIESEERFRAMADNIPNLAWMAHADGHIFWYNSRWYEFTGMPSGSMEGWGWTHVHDPRFIDLVVSRWRSALNAGEAFEMEFQLRGSDGEYRWFLTRVSPVRNDAGKVVRWFGTNTNIDDKRKAEDALKESEELARSVVEGSPEGVELLNEAGETLLINQPGRKFRALRQYPSATWLDSWNKESFDQAATAFSSALAGKSAAFTLALNETTAGPTWLEVLLTPLQDASGKVNRVLSITRDVTKARKEEEKLAQTAKLESLGVMAGGIAHDFNNILTGILGNASLLENTPDKANRELAGNIVKAAARAADFTKQMLAYSGKGRFEVRATDLSFQIREILPLIRPMLDKNVEIQLSLDDALPSVEADASQMHQLIMNLIINGAEAIGGAQGRVIVTTSAIDVDETFISHTFSAHEIPPGRYVCLEVQDTGCGMDEETKAKIFDPFFTTKVTGRGLGLAAVSGIVRGHKGALRIYSSPGEGTTFKIFLPALASVVTPAVRSAGKDFREVRGRETVLLVDDEEIVRQVGAACLQRQGYSVILANNGRQAVDLFKQRSSTIDLIILDMTMPVMGGQEALNHFLDIRSDVPVIFCSGYNEVEVIRKITSQNVAGFVQKPYTSASLIEKVTIVLEASAAKAGEDRNGA